MDVYELYDSIAKDLKIRQFKNELDIDYHFRLIYSAISSWILQMFRDRESEDITDSVSKMHVTLRATDILDSYVKLDPTLKAFFKDSKKTVQIIEGCYINLGYIVSGNYTFKEQNYTAEIEVNDNKSIIINPVKIKNEMAGIGTLGVKTDACIKVNDYLLCRQNAEEYFKTIASQLEYTKWDDSIYGRVEYYNSQRNRWDLLPSLNRLQYDYYVLRIDKGLSYEILKKDRGKFYRAKLPEIYSHSGRDTNFLREIWRIVFGACAYSGDPVKVYVENKYEDGITFSIQGECMLPKNEMDIIKCVSWPQRTSNSINDFVTNKEYVPFIISILRQMSMQILDERGMKYE